MRWFSLYTVAIGRGRMSEPPKSQLALQRTNRDHDLPSCPLLLTRSTFTAPVVLLDRVHADPKGVVATGWGSCAANDPVRVPFDRGVDSTQKLLAAVLWKADNFGRDSQAVDDDGVLDCSNSGRVEWLYDGEHRWSGVSLLSLLWILLRSRCCVRLTLRSKTSIPSRRPSNSVNRKGGK